MFLHHYKFHKLNIRLRFPGAFIKVRTLKSFYGIRFKEFLLDLLQKLRNNLGLVVEAPPHLICLVLEVEEVKLKIQVGIKSIQLQLLLQLTK
jgi:hypothetical protein